jgi:hypothetical protein
MVLSVDKIYGSISKTARNTEKNQRKEVFLGLETDADIVVDPDLVGSETCWFLSNPDS